MSCRYWRPVCSMGCRCRLSSRVTARHPVVCRGDCNLDGFLSIVGDVPCTVDRLFAVGAGDGCPALVGEECVGAVQPMATTGHALTTGGMVFSDRVRPLSSGLSGIAVTIREDASGEHVGEAYTDELGVWRAELPANKVYVFEVDGGRAPPAGQ